MGVGHQGVFRHQLIGDLPCECRIDSSFHIDAGQLLAFEPDVLAQLLALAREIRLLGIRLGVPLDPGWEDALHTVSAEMNLTLSELLRTIIKDWLIANTYLPTSMLEEDSQTANEIRRCQRTGEPRTVCALCAACSNPRSFGPALSLRRDTKPGSTVLEARSCRAASSPASDWTSPGTSREPVNLMCHGIDK